MPAPLIRWRDLNAEKKRGARNRRRLALSRPLPPTPELVALARFAAAQHSLDPALVCAIVEQESAWDSCAIRYEAAFRTRYVAPLGLPATEEVARSISWGLMQVMGQVAREHGFAEKSLAALCDPAAALEIGCKVFAAKLNAAAQDVTRALNLWNGGGNRDYAPQVQARIANYSFSINK